VSTHGIITLALHTGTRTFGSEDEVFGCAGQLARVVRETNLANARARFALGELLVLFAEDLERRGGRFSARAAAAASGVHHQTAKRAVKLYKSLKGPGGGFSLEAWRDLQGKTDPDAKRDHAGDASLSAVERVIGARSAPVSSVPGAPAGSAATPAEDPFDAAIRKCDAEHGGRASGDTRAPARAITRPTTGPMTGPMTGPQLELDFDLAADAAELGAVAADLERAVRSGGAPLEVARRAHETMRSLIAELHGAAAGGVTA
jgi:hypothetical protein